MLINSNNKHKLNIKQRQEIHLRNDRRERRAGTLEEDIHPAAAHTQLAGTLVEDIHPAAVGTPVEEGTHVAVDTPFEGSHVGLRQRREEDYRKDPCRFLHHYHHLDAYLFHHPCLLLIRTSKIKERIVASICNV